MHDRDRHPMGTCLTTSRYVGTSVQSNTGLLRIKFSFAEQITTPTLTACFPAKRRHRPTLYQIFFDHVRIFCSVLTLE
jgi:hypothetical protein